MSMPALAPAAEQIRARLDARCHANDRHWQLTQPAHLPDSVVLMAGICCIEKVLDVVGLCLDPPEMAPFLAAERGGPRAALPPPAPSWPWALRAIRAWFPPRSRCNAGGRHVKSAPAPM